MTAWVQETIYDTVAGIGYVDAIIDLIIGIVLFVVLVIIGFIFIFKRKVGTGAIIIVIAFLVLLFAFVWYYLVINSKGFAAFAGVVAIADVAVGGYKKYKKKLNTVTHVSRN